MSSENGHTTRIRQPLSLYRQCNHVLFDSPMAGGKEASPHCYRIKRRVKVSLNEDFLTNSTSATDEECSGIFPAPQTHVADRFG
ncbi:hypothetical protein E2C01_068465 [Portunus trituberculatus]|uniref:Uncharacterized protein n=1 Tax=Portunus trituberculatus TaxID=210409 RepID=A0A5B7HXY7_PORTR|nr:hypothetical protein [Portunus trituberculatus]